MDLKVKLLTHSNMVCLRSLRFIFVVAAVRDDQCPRTFLLVTLFIQCLVVVSWIAGFSISSR